MWTRFSRMLALLEDGTAGVLIIFASTMLCIQIGVRAIFNDSFSWAEESVRYAIIWMVFIASSIAFRHNAHIRIDVLRQCLPVVLQKPLQLLIIAICMAFSLLLLRYGTALTLQIEQFGQRSPALEAPMYLFYAAIPVSALLMLIRLGESLVQVLRNPSLVTSDSPAGA